MSATSIKLSLVFLLLIDVTYCKQSMNISNSTNTISIYVALGASDAVGIGTSEPLKDGWVPKFASLIHAQNFINLGRSGSTLSDAIHEQLPQALNQKPDIITIWLVVNDFNQQTLDPLILLNYKYNLNTMLSQLRTKFNNDTRILVGNTPDLSEVTIYKLLKIPSKELLLTQINQWNNIINETVQTHQCELVDLFSHWKELAEHPEYISFDGFHPSAMGYTKLAEIFYQKYLQK